MRGEQLAGQWPILRTIESRNHGATVAELADQEGCHTGTIWRDIAAIQEAGFPLYSEKDGQKGYWNPCEGNRFQLPDSFQDWSHFHER
jgi:predicted DNA-binding transcriptional regulator YafY